MVNSSTGKKRGKEDRIHMICIVAKLLHLIQQCVHKSMSLYKIYVAVQFGKMHVETLCLKCEFNISSTSKKNKTIHF